MGSINQRDTINGFIRLVRDMREMQRTYFKRRDPASLKLSKQIEGMVDAEIDRLCGEQQHIVFGGDDSKDGGVDA